MRCFSICTLFLCILSFAAAVPIPGADDGKPPVDKGKGRAVDPPSRPQTPTPEHDPTVPLPGRTGTHTDARTGVVTLHYGDDHLPEHMGHLQRNQAQFPHNRNPNPLSGHAERNRDHALHNIPTAGVHPVTGHPRVRDEKLPNMLHNPHHASSTTVEYLPEGESHKEGGHTSGFKAAIEKVGPNGQGQLRPNPGWLPLHPDQRRGHEAPASLNTQHRADGTHFTTKPPLNADHSKKAASKGATAKSDSHHATGSSKGTESYTPSAVGPNQMGLRVRKGKPAPPPAPPKVDRPARAHGTSNLRPGRVSPPGHVWHPSTGGARASHFGAPGHLKEAEQRHPPRPQNHAHYMQQLHDGRQAEARHGAAPAAPARAHRGPARFQPAQTANLRLFEQRHPAQHGGAAGRAHEAPARMQTPVSHTPAHSRPSSAQGHHSRPASPHHQTLPHHSKPKGGPSGKK